MNETLEIDLMDYYDLLQEGEVLAESGEFKLIKSTNPINTHGYAISAHDARKLLKDLEVNEAGRQIDVELTSRVHNGFLRSYSIDRTTMIQWKTNDDPSDIPESAPPFERQELLNSTRRLLEYKQITPWKKSSTPLQQSDPDLFINRNLNCSYKNILILVKIWIGYPHI
ncbi:3111_t:CDS:2 [Cetraspora pellucida]|uniref:3111_t:CDS:1 n=1 Tax=Cetraspora pellucida TaxID=1433469 RepID=A0ACA9KU85_9GLOM|nr:3111_t:CDS:2 [Cetraspora pellucida]